MVLLLPVVPMTESAGVNDVANRHDKTQVFLLYSVSGRSEASNATNFRGHDYAQAPEARQYWQPASQTRQSAGCPC
ncbi:hypothetical protein [Rhizobium leguminosarum]|uniref:hypothetical protein n=1 Tax=Rhizobium leguminosarum TaxID=384 RepID=UPI0015F94B28|nr:hypothetical protein [Rhizobium leguminosarum]MBA9032872.1 hypothetical protein [Rhizobium leguminosarum]